MRPPPAAVLSLCSILITAGALEVGARVWADPTGGNSDIVAFADDARRASVLMKSPDPELIYVTRPGYVRDGVRISEAHGILRSDDVTVVKPAGTFRIAVVGDSIAAGHPLRKGPTPPFAFQLERRLNAAGAAAHVEVLLFAADGYGTLQEARLLETEVARFSPDVVVLAYCLNDPSNSYTPTVWFLDDPGPRSYLLDLVRRRLGFTPSELSPAHPRYTHGTIDWDALYRVDGPSWTTVENGFRRIEAFGRNHHAPALLVMFPLLLTGEEPPADRERATRLYAQVRDAAAAHHFRFLDLRDAYHGHTAAEIRFLPEDPIHPGALGHTLAAEAIEAALVSGKLLPY
jgi:lysophospholipase L1-like esterase